MTKKTFAVLALLLNLFAVLPSQTYHPMLVKGRAWDELHFAPEICWADYGVRNRVPSADSLLGMTWSHVQYTWVMSETPTFCGPYSVDTTAWNTAGYELREDTAARQVWIQSPAMSPALLYDFSLSVGDTFVSPYATQGLPKVVTSISDVTLLDGTVVKQFDFAGGGWYIESIGGWQGLYGWLETVEYPMQIKCVSQDDVPLWNNGGCFTIVSTEDGTALTSVKVFPNPATTSFVVETDGSVAQLELLNAQGQVVLTQPHLQRGASVDVRQLPQGIYLWRISSKSGSAAGRLVIAH
jgi:hypothetical protein